jgi:hypothetical protein
MIRLMIKGKRIDSGNKQGTFVKLNKDKSGKWLWYGYVNDKLPKEYKHGLWVQVVNQTQAWLIG